MNTVSTAAAIRRALWLTRVFFVANTGDFNEIEFAGGGNRGDTATAGAAQGAGIDFLVPARRNFADHRALRGNIGYRPGRRQASRPESLPSSGVPALLRCCEQPPG